MAGKGTAQAIEDTGTLQLFITRNFDREMGWGGGGGFGKIGPTAGAKSHENFQPAFKIVHLGANCGIRYRPAKMFQCSYKPVRFPAKGPGTVYNLTSDIRGENFLNKIFFPMHLHHGDKIG